ncbi:MAG TPA: BREX system P-loop protein BrxC [Actinomycetota bacterium]|nr:BREX system P-loop protein BrxC [Actinomycetota bacterium]
MKIAELFRRPIDRRIEEVIKVDVAEEEIVADELDEYVVTGHIEDAFENVLNDYQETILSPSEKTTIWVSGFFGSGKSSFAKVLGHVLENRTLSGRSASGRFLARVNERRIEALLNTIHAQAPTNTVFADLSTGRDVLNEGESIVLPVYRSMLRAFGYSTNPTLAELEYDLETDGDLEDFIEAFAKISGAKGSWEERRNIGLAKGEASHAMHLLRPDTYPHADSWAKAASAPTVDANWFAKRAVALLERRGDGAQRLAFVVDEVGQYVARSVQRMLDLQGLAEAIQKQRGKLWLVVTSQETLNDVVDSLEGRQVELARVQARFPIRVDLLPADIDEVVGKRVLDKSDAGQQAVRDALAPHRNKLAANTKLDSPARGHDLAEEEFVRLYPLLPYQVQLLIDAVHARRGQGGGTPMLGGSNRTLIKLAQQLVVDPGSGLGEERVGALVTLDRAYDLLESIMPTSWRAEIRGVADRYGEGSLEAAVAKTVALCADIRALPLSPGNVAVLLHPAVDAEPRKDEVTEALGRLAADEVVRRVEDGYRLQSPHEKDWERTRRGIEARPADRTRLRRALLKDALSGLTVTEGRTFKVGLTVDGEKVLDGEVRVEVEEADADRRDALRERSRDTAAEATMWVTFEEASDTTDTLDELHRSNQMIARRETARDPNELELLGEERNRQRRLEREAVGKLERDMLAGQTVFRGRTDQITGTSLKAAVQEAMRSRIREIYPRLDEFCAPVTKNDVRAILRADTLDGLPDYLGDIGIGLIRLTPQGPELATDRDPLDAVVGYIRERASYGNEATGKKLEDHFGDAPFGAPVEVVQALAAAAVRAGVVEAVSSGQRLSRADDARLEQVFATIPRFRTTSFVPQRDGVDLPVRTQLAERLAEITGERPPPVIDALADLVRRTFAADGEAAARIGPALRALGLTVPAVVERTADLVARVTTGSDEDTVRTAAEAWADLTDGRQSIGALARIVDDELDVLRNAVRQRDAGPQGLDDEFRADHEKLRDLLSAGDLATNMGQIRSLTERLETERHRARTDAAAELAERLAAAREALRAEHAATETTVLDEALRPLDDLEPTDDTPIEVIRARADAVDTRTHQIRAALDAAADRGAVVRVPVSAVVPEPIATGEDLDEALTRIRRAVEEQLGPDTKVRLT